MAFLLDNGERISLENLDVDSDCESSDEDDHKLRFGLVNVKFGNGTRFFPSTIIVVYIGSYRFILKKI